MENQTSIPTENQTSNGLLVSFSGLLNYTDSQVQNSGMGQLSNSQTLADNNITTMVYDHTQTDEALQATIDYHAQHPNNPIDVAGHSMGADSAIQLTNQLGEREIPVNHLFTISPPPESMTSNLTNPEVEHYNFYTSGQDYGHWGYGTDDPMLNGAQNIEVGESHTNIDSNQYVHQFIEQTVINDANPNEPVNDVPKENPSEPINDYKSLESDTKTTDYSMDASPETYTHVSTDHNSAGNDYHSECDSSM